MKRFSFLLPLLLVLSLLFSACTEDKPPMGEVVRNRDSLPIMITGGCSKIISDSGVVRYRIVAEEWKVFDKTTPSRMEFVKGIFMERFDRQFRPNLLITADTAFCYNQSLWELRGRVVIKNKQTGTLFKSEELFWDQSKHLVYGNKYMRIVEPDREIEGDTFKSNEDMTMYEITQSSGFMPSSGFKKSMNGGGAPAANSNAASDSASVGDSTTTAPPAPAAAPQSATNNK